MKTLTYNDIEIQIIAEYETEQLEGNLIDMGDKEQEAKIIAEVQEKIDNGNVWAWAQVEVKCTYKGILTASDYLGCCSYDGEHDFMSGGYYDYMVNTCLEDLNRQLKELCEC